MKCQNFNCEYLNSNGYCSITACVKHRQNTSNIILETNDCIIFPHTIGSITFHTKKELIDWVMMQQDSEYGMGNYA